MSNKKKCRVGKGKGDNGGDGWNCDTCCKDCDCCAIMAFNCLPLLELTYVLIGAGNGDGCDTCDCCPFGHAFQKKHPKAAGICQIDTCSNHTETGEHL